MHFGHALEAADQLEGSSARFGCESAPHGRRTTSRAAAVGAGSGDCTASRVLAAHGHPRPRRARADERRPTGKLDPIGRSFSELPNRGGRGRRGALSVPGDPHENAGELRGEPAELRGEPAELREGPAELREEAAELREGAVAGTSPASARAGPGGVRRAAAHRGDRACSVGRRHARGGSPTPAVGSGRTLAADRFAGSRPAASRRPTRPCTAATGTICPH